MKFTNSDVLNDLLEEIAKELPLLISYNEGVYTVDLNTGMKSDCVMRIHHDQVDLSGRYNTHKEIMFWESYTGELREEFLRFVAGCKNYRDYAHQGWWKVMENNGIDLSYY